MKITKRVVEAVPPPTTGYTLHWDSTLRGFGLRVTASGVRSFILRCRINGKERRITLGRYGPLTTEQARREATKLLGAIATGRDPVAERRQSKAEAVSLGQVFAEYLQARELRPKTRADYQRVIRVSFADWRGRPLREVTGDEVARRHADLGANHGKAWGNLSMRLLRALFNFAAASHESLSLDNPVKRLSRTRSWFRVDRRTTLIKPHQLPAWWAAVLGLDNTLARNYLQVVALTGLRRSEALGLRWQDVDLVGRTLTVRETKNHTDHTLPLPPYLAALLDALPRHGARVFEGLRPDSAVAEVARRSGVAFTVHDLRRTFATIADGLDIPGYAVKGLLNHSGGSDVTSGYVVVTTERLRAPMARISEYVLRCAGVEESAEVVSINR